jgi:hypothetical protein
VFIAIALMYSFFTLKRQFSATKFGLSRLAFRAVASGSITAVHALLALVGLVLPSKSITDLGWPDLLQGNAGQFRSSGRRRKFGYCLRVRFRLFSSVRRLQTTQAHPSDLSQLSIGGSWSRYGSFDS